MIRYSLFICLATVPLLGTAQNVGIGTNAPAARLHVADSSVLFSGPATLSLTPGNPPVSGAGARMMWYADKAAFRAGMVTGPASAYWDKDNIGVLSVAFGNGTAATGNYSFAMGTGSISSGLYAAAFGLESKASGWGSNAMGVKAEASGEGSTALGWYTTAKAVGAFAVGISNDNTDNPNVMVPLPEDRIFQVGNGNMANTVKSNALTILRSGNVGIGTNSPGERLEVSGRVFLRSLPGLSAGIWFDNTFSNFKSAFIGMQTDNRIGIYGGDGAGWAFTVNTQNGRVGVGTTSSQNPLDVVAGPSSTATKLTIGNRGGFGPAALEFVSDYGLSSQWRPGYIASNDLGGFTGRLEFFTNGTGSNNLYGAVKGLEVRNGTTLTATGSVGSFSDSRLKNNIEPFTDGLNVIEQINPVQFQYKPEAPFASPDKQVGIVAQDLEKVAPYMVHQTAEGNVKDMRWVDNQAYVFLLINAVKELQQQVRVQQKEIEKLKGQMR